jgi:hypothetical protein
MNLSNQFCVLRRVLTEDLPGEHWYVLECEVCRQQDGEEWVERHHGVSEARPALPRRRCPGRPAAHAVAA